MCEALVWLADQPRSNDPAIDSQRYRRGDVIVVCPDGWGWGSTELTKPEWIILRLPGVAVPEGRTWTASEPLDSEYRRYRWRRLFHLDLPADWPAVRTVESVTVSAADVRAMRRRREPIVDPDLIG